MPEASDLRAVRDFFGLTQPELAEWLGVHRVQIAYAENGQRALPLRAAARLTPFNLCVARAVGGAPAAAPVPIYVAPLLARLAECRFEAVRISHALRGLGPRA